MAKQVDGLQPQMRYDRAARLVILAKLDEMFQEEAGTRVGEDIEFLHDMRVASRRLRAAMTVFEACFPRRDYRPLQKMAASVTRGLGEVRDRDVMLDFLGRYLKKLPAEERPGIEDLAATLRDERDAYRITMLQALDDADRAGFRPRLEALLTEGQR